MTRIEGYLKKHAEALVKDVGIASAARLTGKSRTTLGRCYSTDVQHDVRFMPIHSVAQLDAVAQVEVAPCVSVVVRRSTFPLFFRWAG